MVGGPPVIWFFSQLLARLALGDPKDRVHPPESCHPISLLLLLPDANLGFVAAVSLAPAGTADIVYGFSLAVVNPADIHHTI